MVQVHAPAQRPDDQLMNCMLEAHVLHVVHGHVQHVALCTECPQSCTIPSHGTFFMSTSSAAAAQPCAWRSSSKAKQRAGRCTRVKRRTSPGGTAIGAASPPLSASPSISCDTAHGRRLTEGCLQQRRCVCDIAVLRPRQQRFGGLVWALLKLCVGVQSLKACPAPSQPRPC